MSTTNLTKNEAVGGAGTSLLPRILREGYGPGAWHGADLKSALKDVSRELLFWRPQKGRHNIAEIALHHAYFAHAVRARLTGAATEPFALEGEDWFPTEPSFAMSWDQVLDLVEAEQERLAGAVGEISAGRLRSPLPEPECLDLVLGITCHAIYHAGQVQLIKRLHDPAS